MDSTLIIKDDFGQYHSCGKEADQKLWTDDYDSKILLKHSIMRAE